MDEITIHVFVDADGNYQYNIYDCPPEDVETSRPIDGGTCEMTMSSAMGIAIDHTKSLLRRLRK